MAYEFFYEGSPSSMDPGYGDLFLGGYREHFKNLGMTTHPASANKLADVAMKFNTGIKVMEIEGITPEIFESIPNQHLDELNRMSKLAGAEVTLHGPLVEASGFSKEGWSERNRESAERQINMVVDRAHKLNPKGNIPITFHSTAMLPETFERYMEKVNGEYKEVPKSMLIVEPRTGDIKQVKDTEKYFPGETGSFNPEKELEKFNKDRWTETIGNVNFGAYRGEDALKNLTPEMFKEYGELKNHPEKLNLLSESGKEMAMDYVRNLDHASIFLKDSYRHLKELYNSVYHEADESDKKRLNEYAKQITPLVEEGFESKPEKLQEFSKAIQEGISVLGSIKIPKIYRPLNDFVIEKTAQTFASAALKGYDKYKDSAPIITIENPPAGSGLSRADDLKQLVESSREEFIKKAIKEGIPKQEAAKAAEKLIGATWDVGHINMIRKYGYESKDIIKETEKIAPFVKHVHLSDNFGFEHTELPMGMGNVPIKEMLNRLGKEGFDGKKIIEAGHWWNHFKTPPLVPTLEAFGSSFYSLGGSPYWNQGANVPGGYFSGYGPILPEQHFSMYGTGFSGMPLELGGQMPGKASRMSGTPMD